MEARLHPMPYTMPNGTHPSSPPMTPGGHLEAHFPPPTSQTSTIYKHMGLSGLSQSPPSDSMESAESRSASGAVPPHSRGHASGLSNASGSACTTDAEDSEYETDSDGESTEPEEQPARRVQHGNFEIEELHSDPGYASNLEVVQPDHCEDAKSEKSGRTDDHGLSHKFTALRCDDSSSEDEEELQRIYRRKKKRWSAGIFKRSHSQSIEGDSSYSDDDPLDDNDSTTRRLRRRVRGPGDRTSLIFEDRGFSNANNIAEVEEPEEAGVPHTQGPPSIPSDDGFTLDELPFWYVEDPMDLECESV